MGGNLFGMVCSLAVVHNFHVAGVPFVPTKADAILAVTSDAVLPGTVLLQSFQPVPGPCKKVRQPRRGIQGVQPAPRSGLSIHKSGLITTGIVSPALRKTEIPQVCLAISAGPATWDGYCGIIPTGILRSVR